MEELELVAIKRDGKSTKKELSGLRGSFNIPAVIYGEGKPPFSVSLDERNLLATRKKGGLNAVIHLKIEDNGTETVILKDLQRHPVSERPIHADFQRISLTRKIEAKVPLHILGEASGVKNSGGILQHELRFLAIRALPTHIPAAIEVDVSSLEINQHLSVKDLKVPSDVEVLDNPEHRVVHVSTFKEEAAAAPAVAADVAATAAAGTAAEPESSSTKGKKDEEGKLAKDAKAPAAGGDAKAAASKTDKAKEAPKK